MFDSQLIRALCGSSSFWVCRVPCLEEKKDMESA